ncbi:hypothetical protein KK062_06060 [Fulvivirgaceae bacterium PWU5]|uniref:Uncharacterized protein n=1 Tax=Dawidia cretensis TaxID=2782350 RepID=A0AAP2GP00_9BACT|nr:hypothetical protein [Dawidia cretensis]MBT1707774.1 hypothetical protein [Dawidia cretensis]
MNFFFLYPDKNLKDKAEERLIHQEPSHGTNEGSEFLDDALYMHDQPLLYAEESVAAGTPRIFCYVKQNHRSRFRKP